MKNLHLLNFKSAVRRKARWLITLIAILTLGVGQMWGASTVNGGYVYFDASTSGWSVSDVQFVIGHSSYSAFYNMSNIGNTKLYYISAASWGDATYFAFANGCSSWGAEGNSYDSRKSWISGKYTDKKESYTLNSGSTYLFYASSSANNSAITTSSPAGYLSGGYSALNSTQTIKSQLSTDGGSTYSDANTKAAISITSYAMTGNGAATEQTASISTSAKSTTVSAARTATTTLSIGDVAAGYEFVGWYVGSTQKSTSTSYTYYPTAATTVVARFKETRYEVKVATITPSAGGSATPTSWTYMGQISGGNITATPNTGYSFSGWSILSGGAGYFGESGTATTSSTANTKFRPTKSSSLKATFTANSYTFTLDGNEGSDGSVTIKYDSDAPTTISHSSRAGYSLNGYYTAASGGTKVINANGSLNNVSGWVSGGYWKQTDETQVLYAQWTEDVTNYSVTYGVKSDQTSLGTLSCATTSGSTPISSGGEVASGTGVTFTASPITGYEVDAWCSDAACTSPIAGAGYANTYATTVSANTTVYVKFKKKIYTITYSPSSAPTGCTYTTKPTTGTYGNTVTMVITPSTGYTVSVSARDASSNVVTISNPSANTYTFTQPASAVTVTVTATETMSSLSTSCSYDAGTPGYAAPAVTGSYTNVGYATTRTITATAAGTGYTFAGWTLTNCTRTDGGSPTATSITIRSNGDGAAATVVANYNEVLTQSTWIIKGGTAFGGTAWTTEHALTKQSGHSTESVVYKTFTISSTNTGDSNDNFKFKVVKKGSPDAYFGLTADGSYYLFRSESGTEKTLATENADIQLRADIVGDYVFKVDYSTPASPKLTVTFPTSYTLTYDIGTVKGTAGSITSSPTTASESLVIGGSTVTLTAPEAKNGYAWKGWYTNAAGTSAQQCSTREYAVTMNANKTLYACYDVATCTAPTAFTASSVNAKGATLTVTDAWDTNAYDLYISTSSTAPTSVTSATTTISGGKAKTISNLYAGTKFYAWARTNCGDSKSTWTALTGSSFTTSTVSVTHTLTNVTKSSGGTTAGGSNYTATYTANTGYSMPTPSVTIGGNTATSGTDYTWSSGTLTIPQAKITGNIVVTLNSAPSAPTNVAISGAYHYYPGETISLTATATGGNGPKTYQWYHGGKEDGNMIAGATSATYTKASCVVGDAGSYYCKVTCGGSASRWSDGASQDPFNVKIMQFYLKNSSGGDISNHALEKVDATHATLTLHLTGGTTYKFRITDGCNDWYGNTGTMTYSNCTNWPMDADADCGMTTGLKTANYTFNFDFTDGLLGSQMKVSVVYPGGDQAAGKIIYWDNSVLNWADGKQWYRIGRVGTYNKTQMTKVSGTANLYKITTAEYLGFEYWHVANNDGNGDDNLFWTKGDAAHEITNAMAFEGAPVTADAVTVTPTTSHATGETADNNNCEFYTYGTTNGMKTDAVTITAPTNGTITVSYTNTSGSAASFTSGSQNLAHTCIITPTGSGATGYHLSGLTVNGNAHTSGNTYTVTDATTVAATFAENTYNLTFTHNGHGTIQVGGVTVAAGGTAAVNHFTTKTLVATPEPGYYFTGWTKSGSNTGAVTIASESSASTTIKATNTGATITANFAPIWRIACSDDSYSTSSKQITNITTSAGVMTSGYVDVSLNANTEYEFKVFNASDNHWWGNNGSITKIIYTNRTTNTPTLSDNAGNNQTFRTAAAGTYRFTWDVSTSKVTITYPTSYKITIEHGYWNAANTLGAVFDSGSATGGTVTSAVASVSGSLAVTNTNTVTQYVGAGETVTFTHSTANTGWAWYAWGSSFNNGSKSVTQYTNGSGGVTINDGARTMAIASISADKTVYGFFKENVSTITINTANSNYGDLKIGGAASSWGTSVTLGATTTKTIKGEGKNGYMFTTWALSGAATKASGILTDQQITIQGNGTASSSGTATASFAPGYVIRGSLYDDSGNGGLAGWDNTTAILVPNLATGVGTYTATLQRGKRYKFKVYFMEGSGYWRGTSETSDISSGVTYTLPEGGNDITFTAGANGTYTFTYNFSTKALTVLFPTAYTVTYYGNGSTSGSVPTDATPYASGETVNVQGNTGSLAKSDYTLSGWNTTEHITGTTYGSAGGATFTITANTDLYAKWTQTISLDRNSGTTGSTTATATYNCSSLSGYTAPTRTGYTFAGYWTSETSNNGSGTLVIDTEGNLQANVSGYTGADGIWTSSTARTLYARWTTEALRFTTAGNWNTPSNWTPACVPTAEHDVIIQKPCSVDIANAAAKSVVIYNNGSGKTGSLNIGATKGLNVTGTIQKTTNGSTYGPTSGYDLVLESSASGNASLVFNNSNGCQAWVLMYSKGNHDGSKWNWQYVGTPFTGTIANPNYAGSYLYKWIDATTSATFGWTTVTNENEIEPWVGYCLTQPSPVTLEMEGTLMATDGLGNVTRSFNDNVVANTPKVLANSWTAPIQIKQMTAADFSNVQQTIYLFNTGNAEAGKPGTEGTEAGTYITVSINASPYTGDSVISSMQGFYVKKLGAGASASITLNYGKHVRPSGNNAIGQGPMKAPKQDELKPQWMKIIAQGSRYASKLYLFSREDFTYGFDDGWDGENINDAGASALMYSPREDGTKDAISAIPEFEGAVVGFEAGEDSEYTFSFTYEGDEEWYLNDLHTWNSTRISAENTYTFGTTDNDDIRFVISAQPLEKMPEGIDDTNAEGARARKLLIRDKLYIILNGRIYDGTGKIVMDK